MVGLVSKRRYGGRSWEEEEDKSPWEKEPSTLIPKHWGSGYGEWGCLLYGEDWQHLQAQKVGEDLTSQNPQGHLPRYPHVVCAGPRFFS